VIRIFTFR